jgi:hypothetical protein
MRLALGLRANTLERMVPKMWALSSLVPGHGGFWAESLKVYLSKRHIEVYGPRHFSLRLILFVARVLPIGRWVKAVRTALKYFCF